MGVCLSDFLYHDLSSPVQVTLPEGMTALPTTGHTLVTIRGEDLGDRLRLAGLSNGGSCDRFGCNSPINTSEISVTYGPDGYGYEAQLCNMTEVGTEIQCYTVPGVGAGHHWRITHKAAFSERSPGTTRYRAPSVTQIIPEYEAGEGHGGFKTQGGQNVTLLGSDFGPLGTVVSVYYQNDDNVSVSDFANANDDAYYTALDNNKKEVSMGSSRFDALHCTVTDEHVQVECTTVPGVGAEQYWVVTAYDPIGGQPQANPRGSSPTTRYLKPVIESLSLNRLGDRYPSGVQDGTTGHFLLETFGGQEVWLNGSNFGPMEPHNPMVVMYQNLQLDNLAGSPLFAHECRLVVPHSAIRCTTIAGVGHNQSWHVQVGKQWSNQSLEFVTSYFIPVMHEWANPDDTHALGSPGAERLLINGENFGPLVSTNVIAAAYHNPLLVNMAGSYFHAVQCEVTIAHTQIACLTVEGVGYNHTWALVVGHQGDDTSTVLQTSYHIPELSGWANPELASGLATRGQEHVYLNGQNLGPNVSSNVFTATYVNTELSGLAGMVFRAVECVVVVSHERARCLTVEGVGYNHTWSVVVGQQSDDGLAYLQTSYLGPQLLDVEAQTRDGKLGTVGGEWVHLHGTNFGPNTTSAHASGWKGRNAHPGSATQVLSTDSARYIDTQSELSSNPAFLNYSLPLNSINASYANPSLFGEPHRGGSLAGATYYATECEVLSHELARCKSVEGIGFRQLWALTIGHQHWPVEEVSSRWIKDEVSVQHPFNEDQTTSYRAPSITELRGPNGQSSLRPGAMAQNHFEAGAANEILLNASGGEDVILRGTDFGPDEWFQANYYVSYRNALLEGLAGYLYEPKCNMTEAHVEIRCTVLPGVGSNHSWALVVGNQTDKASNDTSTSFFKPEIVHLDQASIHPGLQTDGSSLVTVTGRNFGPVHPSNLVTAVYEWRDSAERNALGTQHLSHPYRFGLPLLDGTTYAVTSCNVTKHDVEVVCGTLIGVGRGMRWAVEVGQQDSHLSNDTTKYVQPEVTRICGPGECLYSPGDPSPVWYSDAEEAILNNEDVDGENNNLTAWRQVLAQRPQYADGTLSTTGGEIVYLQGTNFGPAVGPNGYAWVGRGGGANLVTVTYATMPRHWGDQAYDTTNEAAGNQMERETRVALCNVTSDHGVMTCVTEEGVGARHHWTVEVGGQASNASAATTSYTAPRIIGIDARTFAKRFVADTEASLEAAAEPLQGFSNRAGNVTKLVFDTPGGNVVTLDGTDFGPATFNNSVTVELVNRELALPGKFQGLSSIAAQHYRLLDCTVTQAHVRVQCVVPPGVGRDHRWQVTVGSQVSEQLQNFSSSYSEPNIFNVSLTSAANVSRYLDQNPTTLGNLETLGGDVITFVGQNFGPAESDNQVYAGSRGANCSACNRLNLNWTLYRDYLNFQATFCQVVVNHTAMRCVVPPGVGQNHTWTVYVGVQDSVPLNSTQTAYERPVMQLIVPITGPTQAVVETSVTLTGRYFGDPSLAFGSVRISTCVSSTKLTVDSNSVCEETRHMLEARPTQHRDGQLVFDAHNLGDFSRGGECRQGTALCLMHGDAPITFMVGGVETAVALQFRYHTVLTMFPIDAPRNFNQNCLSYDNVTVQGFGFLTNSEYFALGYDEIDGEFQARGGVPPQTRLLMTDSSMGTYEEYLNSGYAGIDCEAGSDSLLLCPMSAGYTGPVKPEGNVQLVPVLSMNFNHSWSFTRTVHPKLFTFVEPGEFTYWTLPLLDSIQDVTGPRTGDTNVTVVGSYFKGTSFFFARFGLEFVECEVLSESRASCNSPALLPGIESSLAPHEGLKVPIAITVERRLSFSGKCLVTNNVSFYYHPHAVSFVGPFPQLVPVSGDVAQSAVVDSSPFLGEGRLSGRAFDFEGALMVRNGVETVVASREDHHVFNVSLVEEGNVGASVIPAGQHRLVKLTFNTKKEIESDAMEADCSDIFFWASDYVTELAYWMEPLQCNAASTTFLVRLPGPLGDDDDGTTTAEVFMNFGAGKVSSAMDGNAVFSLADGYSTHDSPYASTALWAYPEHQQQVDDYRFRYNYDAETVVEQSLDKVFDVQYKGNWSYLVMARTEKTFEATLRVDALWRDLAKGATYVLYLSDDPSCPYVPFAEGYFADTTLHAAFYTRDTSEGGFPELAVWGADPDGRAFSNSTVCDAVPFGSAILAAKATLVLGSDLSASSGSRFEVRVQVEGLSTQNDDSSWVACASVEGFNTRTWGYSGDTWHYPNGSAPMAAALDAADGGVGTPQGLGTWEFAAFPDVYLFSGVDQPSNSSLLGGEKLQHGDVGWAVSHAWLTVDSSRELSTVKYLGSTLVSAEGATSWRLRYTSHERHPDKPANSLSVAFNGQGFRSKSQFTGNLSTVYAYVTPVNLEVSPNLVDLTSLATGANSNLNLTIVSSDVSAAMLNLGWDARIGWADLPLNLDQFGSGHIPDGVVNLYQGVHVRVGTFEAPCAPHASLDYALACSLDGASQDELMSNASIAISFNGGRAFTFVDGGSLSLYTLSATVDTTLVGSYLGGTTLAGKVELRTSGTSRNYRFENVSVVLRSSTDSGVELTLPEPSAVLVEFDGSGGSDEVSFPFNVTVPHAEGITARDNGFVHPGVNFSCFNNEMVPVYSWVNETVANGSANVFATEPLAGTNVNVTRHVRKWTRTSWINTESSEDIRCPPDSTLNCTFCPMHKRYGAKYPCYRPAAELGTAGRCLAERDTSVRFSPTGSARLLFDTNLHIDGEAVTTGGSSPDEPLETAAELSFYDPASLIESMNPLGAAAVRRATDDATDVTFTGDALTAAMTPILKLQFAGQTYGGAGVSQRLVAELGSNYGYYPRTQLEYPVSTEGVTIAYEQVQLLRQPTRFQSVYLASELSDASFKIDNAFGAIYIKISGVLRANLLNFRVRMAHYEDEANNGQVVKDEELTLVAGPRTVSVGDVESWEDGKDSDGQWVRIELDTAFVWNGVNNVLVDVSYNARPWGQGVNPRNVGAEAGRKFLAQTATAANVLLRATLGYFRTSLLLGTIGGDGSSGRVKGNTADTAVAYGFVPFIMFETASAVALQHLVKEEFPEGESSTKAGMLVDVTVNAQPHTYLAEETSRIVPGALMFMDLAFDPSSSSRAEDDFAGSAAMQADLRSVLVAAFQSVDPNFKSQNLVVNSVGASALSSSVNAKELGSDSSNPTDDSTTNGTASATRRSLRRGRRLLGTATNNTVVVELKAVSTADVSVTSKVGAALLDTLDDSADTIFTDLQSTSTFTALGFSGLTVSPLSLNLNTTQGFLASAPTFLVYNTRAITVGSVDPALSSIDGGTFVTIGGAGFFKPNTRSKKAEVRWSILGSDVWLTSYGEVGNCFTTNGVQDCNEIYTVRRSLSAPK
jgi:hypothetical protein